MSIPDAGMNGGAFGDASSLSSRRAVLLHALETVDALVDVCGDFLSSKVEEDLWPLLKVSRRRRRPPPLAAFRYRLLCFVVVAVSIRVCLCVCVRACVRLLPWYLVGLASDRF